MKRLYIRFAFLALAAAAPVLLASCSFKSSEERLTSFCIDELGKQLDKWAKYGGWSTNNAKAQMFEMKPDVAANAKYSTNQFYEFEVIVSDFTMKNGFNAEVKSFASCKGRISKDAQGKFDLPSPLLVSFTVDGEKLGL